MTEALIHVACAADEAYAPHCAAMLHSLFEQHRGRARAHFLHGPALSPKMRTRLQRLAEREQGEIRFHEIPDAAVAGLPTLSRIPSLMWYRIFLPELLAGEARVLYLDADTLVVDRLDALWTTDLAGGYLGAIRNVLRPEDYEWPQALGLRDAGDYFNSGVLLMDLELMRRDGLPTRIREHGIREGARLRYPDQDALNAVVNGKWQRLHPRWNCMNSLTFFADAPSYFEPDAVAEAVRAPGIVHFEGPNVVKPWHFVNRNRHRARYYRHLRASGWPVPLPEGMTLRNIAKVVLPEAMKAPLRKALRWLGQA